MNQKIKILLLIVLAALLTASITLQFPNPPESPSFELTPAEQDWLKIHGDTIRVTSLLSSPPVAFTNKAGQCLGLAPDYLRLLEQQLGIKFIRVKCDEQERVLDKLKNNEVDLVGLVQNTPEFYEFLRFTKPCLSIPNVLITRPKASDSLDHSKLKDMRISTVSGSVAHVHLLDMHPEYILIPVGDASTGFHKVSSKEVDIMVTDLGMASYYAGELGVSNLRVSKIIDHPLDLRVGSRRDRPILNAILNKALDSIPLAQHRAIRQRWITPTDAAILPRTELLELIGLILLVTLLVITILFRLRILKQEAKAKTNELDHARDSHNQTTRAVDQSEERFRGLVESSDDIIWETDKFGSYTYISSRVRDILGFEPEWALGKNSLAMMMPADASKNIPKLCKATINSISHGVENTHLHKDGHKVILEMSGMAFSDSTGQLAGFRGVSRDITIRKQDEEELRKLRTMLRSIINSMPSILIGVDEDGLVTEWNREAEQFTKITELEAAGKSLEEVFPELSKETIKTDRAIRERTTQNTNRIQIQKETRTCHVNVTVYPLLDNDTRGAVIRVDDVTDRVRIDEMMVQSEKMMSVGVLAAGMAHEINNPLAGILQNLQVMRNRIINDTERNKSAATESGTSLEAIRAYMHERGLLKMIDSITETSQRIATIVGNMLSFSRKDESNFEPNNLAEILERSIELAANDYDLTNRFDFRHIKIDRDYDELPPIPCESSQIQQVILNLLSNSAQSMAECADDSKELRITLRLKRKKTMALIKVEDNGPGMDKETRKRVFEPFFTTKKVGKGTGLGLSVSYFIITENHGGTMAVKSEPNEGTCISIRIPLEQQKALWGLKL